MDKKGKEDWQGLIWLLVFLFGASIFVPLITINIKQVTNPCPQCDCNAYQDNLSRCLSNNENLSEIVKNRPIQYKNNTIVVPEYKDLPKIEIISSFILTISSIGLGIFLFFKLHLFKIEIKFPEEIDKEIVRYKKLIKIGKIITIVLTALLILKLIILIIAI